MSSCSSSAWTDYTPAPSNPSFLQNHHIRFHVMSHAILLSFPHHPPFCSTEPDSDSEIYLHREIGDQNLN
jgi:hypothetical protein